MKVEGKRRRQSDGARERKRDRKIERRGEGATRRKRERLGKGKTENSKTQKSSSGHPAGRRELLHFFEIHQSTFHNLLKSSTFDSNFIMSSQLYSKL